MPSPSGHFLHRVSDRQAGQQRWQGWRVQPPRRHFFFFRLDLLACPSLTVILPWACMQGPVA